MKRLAILHPEFGWGGAEAVCVWTIEALKDDFDIHLITAEKGIEIEKINKFFGMNFKKDDFKIITLIYPIKGYILCSHLLQRWFKNNKNKYNLVISTKNEMDFGKKGVQYIHFPATVEAKKKKILKNIYYKFCCLLSHYDKERMKKNLSLTNSYWTQEKIKEVYGIESKVIYPPIEDFPQVSWEEKEDGFVCVGRINPQKNLEMIIEILKGIHKTFPQIHLHIIGDMQNKKYFEKILNITRNLNWIYFDTGLSRQELKTLISKHKYGIHAVSEEHFGMVIAEMIKAGCIPFVPNSGGQVKIVNNENLIYSNKEEAIRKIEKVFNDSELQKLLLEGLNNQKEKFSNEYFVKEIKKYCVMQ